LGYLQTWLLYHNALSRGVEIEDILKYARRSKEKANVEADTVAELKAKLLQQDLKIQELIEVRKKLLPDGDSARITPFTSFSTDSQVPLTAGGSEHLPLKIVNPLSMPTSYGSLSSSTNAIPSDNSTGNPISPKSSRGGAALPLKASKSTDTIMKDGRTLEASGLLTQPKINSGESSEKENEAKPPPGSSQEDKFQFIQPAQFPARN
jgi:hypothetical protein